MPARVFIRPHHISAKRIRYFNAHSHLHKHTTHTINENHRSGSFLISLYLLKKLAQPFHAIVQIMLNSSNRTIQPLKTLTLSLPLKIKRSQPRASFTRFHLTTHARALPPRERKKKARSIERADPTDEKNSDARAIMPAYSRERASSPYLKYPPTLYAREEKTRCVRACVYMYVYIHKRAASGR